jgi:transposase-like protein
MICKYGQSGNIVQYGKAKERQRYLCNDCGHKFIEGADFLRMRTKSRIRMGSTL